VFFKERHNQFLVTFPVEVPRCTSTNAKTLEPEKLQLNVAVAAYLQMGDA
jgi:hypothetical protein